MVESSGMISLEMMRIERASASGKQALHNDDDIINRRPTETSQRDPTNDAKSNFCEDESPTYSDDSPYAAAAHTPPNLADDPQSFSRSRAYISRPPVETIPQFNDKSSKGACSQEGSLSRSLPSIPLNRLLGLNLDSVTGSKTTSSFELADS